MVRKKGITLRQTRKYLHRLMVKETKRRVSKESGSSLSFLKRSDSVSKYDDINCILRHFRRIPKKLYKYRECNETNFGVLEKSEIWLSSAENFFDPYDCMIPFTIKELPDEKINTLMKWFVFAEYIYGYEKENLARFANAFKPEEVRRIMFSRCYDENLVINGEETLKYIKKNYPKESYDVLVDKFYRFDKCITQHGRGRALREWFREDCEKGCVEAALNTRKSVFVCSLTETNNNPKMWEEYSDNYSGYCIEFDFSKGIRADSLDDSGVIVALKSILPVFYMHKKPSFDSYKYLLRQYQDTFYEDKNEYWEPELAAELTLYSLIKDAHYSSEQEWRVAVYGEDSGPLWFPFISSIYLGKDISIENRNRLLEIAERINASVYLQIVMPSGFTYECIKQAKSHEIKLQGTIQVFNESFVKKLQKK